MSLRRIVSLIGSVLLRIDMGMGRRGPTARPAMRECGPRPVSDAGPAGGRARLDEDAAAHEVGKDRRGGWSSDVEHRLDDSPGHLAEIADDLDDLAVGVIACALAVGDRWTERGHGGAPAGGRCRNDG